MTNVSIKINRRKINQAVKVGDFIELADGLFLVTFNPNQNPRGIQLYHVASGSARSWGYKSLAELQERLSSEYYRVIGNIEIKEA